MNRRILFIELQHCLFVIGFAILYPILICGTFVYVVLKYIRNIVNTKSIAGQVAVITGSGGGLGRHIAIELAKRGCHVAIVDIQEKLAQETSNFIAKNYQVKTKAYKIDVRDYNQLVELNNSVTTDLGDVTILINNAAILTFSSMRNPPPQEIQQMINVNFTSICFAHQIFLPKMKKLNYGHIVNISSLSALMPFPLFDIYSATKSAVRSMTSTLRAELTLEHKNITATTVMPTILKTNKRIEKISTLTDNQGILPLIQGDIVAQYVVNGMLRGSNEITVPYSFLFITKLLEVLPSCAKEFCLTAIFIFKYNEMIKSSSIADMLKTPEFIV